MIFGRLSLDEDAVHSHRDSFLLDDLTVVSARRPFLGPALIFAIGLGGIGWQFDHLLYEGERIAVIVLCVLAPLMGFKIGALKLLSRDLRGSELSQVIYGSYGHLQRWRTRIVIAIRQARLEDPR